MTAVIPVREFDFTRADFQKAKTLIYQRAGINLGDSKEQLVYSRLVRRLRALGISRFSDYLQRVEEIDGEWEAFVNALTTNLTAFFREQHHFSILAEHLLALQHRPLRLWSAAASTGEEPYSIAMTAIDALDSVVPPVHILASDIDTRVLQTAQAGIYPLERVEKLPLDIKRRFLQKGKGKNSGLVRVIQPVRDLVSFRQINLLAGDWGVREKFDAIFCRNVMIYFDKDTQRRLIEKMVRVLHPHGLFFAGHSETFTHATDLIEPVGRTVYRLVAAPVAARAAR